MSRRTGVEITQVFATESYFSPSFILSPEINSLLPALIFFISSIMSNRISDVLDKSAGKAQVTQGQSLGTFLASLTTSGIILVSGIVAYTLLKLRFPEY